MKPKKKYKKRIKRRKKKDKVHTMNERERGGGEVIED
jgi:hypothetical protein